MQKRHIPLLALLALVTVVGVSAVAQTSSQNPPTQVAPPPSSTAPQASAPPTRQPGPSIDDELQLTPDQKQKIAAIVDDENKQMGAVREDTSSSMEQKQQKAMEIRQAGATKIKGVLTSEQLQKLAALQQKAREQQQNGNPGAPSPH
jgi:Spy/CpxP family protein refolding chaperone